jgi:hypothetical protein
MVNYTRLYQYSLDYLRNVNQPPSSITIEINKGPVCLNARHFSTFNRSFSRQLHSFPLRCASIASHRIAFQKLHDQQVHYWSTVLSTTVRYKHRAGKCSNTGVGSKSKLRSSTILDIMYLLLYIFVCTCTASNYWSTT